MAGGLNLGHELVAEFVHVRMHAAGQAAEAEPDKSALEEMPRRKPSYLAMVHSDRRQSRFGEHAAEINGGHPQSNDCLGQRRVSDPGQHAVRPGLAQPGRRRLAQAVRLEVNRPVSLLAPEAADTANDLPPVRSRRVDEQHNGSLLPCGIARI